MACSATPFIPALAADAKQDPGSSTATVAPLRYVVATLRRIIANPPMLFLLHGFGADEQDLLPLAASLPFADADQSAMLLSGWHVPLTFHRYDGMGHATSDREIADLNGWLQSLA